MTFGEVTTGTLTSAACEALLTAIAAADTSTFSAFAPAAAAAASLGDFDNLQPYQLNLGAAVLQHLLSCGQHLLILDDNTTQHNNGGETLITHLINRRAPPPPLPTPLPLHAGAAHL